jgi:hypothetical protein
MTVALLAGLSLFSSTRKELRPGNETRRKEKKAWE